MNINTEIKTPGTLPDPGSGGVDTGGTFTGFVCRKGDSWAVAKLLSSPSNPARAVLEGWRP